MDAGRGRRCSSGAGAGAGAVVAARPGAPGGAASSGGAGRGEQAELRDGQGGAALGACRSSEAQDDGGGAGWARRRWEGTALCEDRGTALREDRPGLRGFRDLGFQLGRLGRLLFLIYMIGSAFAKKKSSWLPIHASLPSAPRCAHGISNFAECPKKALGKVFFLFFLFLIPVFLCGIHTLFQT